MKKVKYSKATIAHGERYFHVVSKTEAAGRVKYWLNSRRFWRKQMKQRKVASTHQLRAYNRATRNMKESMYILELHLGRIA